MINVENSLFAQVINPLHFFFQTPVPDIVKGTTARIDMVMRPVPGYQHVLRLQVTSVIVRNQGIAFQYSAPFRLFPR